MTRPLMPVDSTAARPTRRRFCALACQTAAAVAAGSMIACDEGPTSPSESAARLPTVSAATSANSVSVPIDATSPLATIGTAALAQTSLGAFLICRTAQDSFSVVTAVCTHEGCIVTDKVGSVYECQCHGSRFTTAGAVVEGPASRALKLFPSEFSGSALTFTI